MPMRLSEILESRIGGVKESGRWKEIPLVYVAGPLAGDQKKLNCRRAIAAGIRIMRETNAMVYIPHSWGESDESFYPDPMNGDGVGGWLDVDYSILNRCDGMFVLDGWEESQGTLREIRFCLQHKIPFFFTNERSLLYAWIDSYRDTFRKEIDDDRKQTCPQGVPL
jgi:hypothetical protein